MQLEGQALQALDAVALRRWCAAAVTALQAAREELDALNVYPVPDSDTGTNLLLTLQAVHEAVESAAPDLEATVRAVVHGGLQGARGNSGIIVSQLLRGLCEAVADPALQGGPGGSLREGLVRGEALARAAVAAPVEGTVLSVARAAAEGCSGPDLAAAVRAASAAAVAALARTPDQLEALRRAGVVDAGGRGWCVLLEALEQVVSGTPPAGPALVVPREGTGAAVREVGSDAYAYEVQYLLSGADETGVARLREVLAALGDSLVVVGSGDEGPEGLWSVHVHVDDVGAAVEAGVEAGRPHRITVTRFADQVAEQVAEQSAGRVTDRVAVRVADRAPAAAPLAVLAPARGAGLRALLAGAGAVPAVLVPTEPADLAAAERLAGEDLHVVPSRSPVQALAALAVADPALPPQEAAARMAEAARGVHWGRVTRGEHGCAVEADGVDGGVDGGADGGADPAALACDLLDRLLSGGGELVTVLLGAEAPAGLAERLRARAGTAEVAVHDGGGPGEVVVLGVEP